ncbi:hypothetical protein NA57DRAFT_62442 [Rhizodiscina lignyota]|uniref:Uncharacterized protein n=1 Tax=Rhizodiscina lignyota TaxID=1504668 RepID=A0A9P4I4R5_9PEZI|nr:hypothetical protein NA57DRAFT_62442 [Rhizodiscina lignyota]
MDFELCSARLAAGKVGGPAASAQYEQPLSSPLPARLISSASLPLAIMTADATPFEPTDRLPSSPMLSLGERVRRLLGLSSLDARLGCFTLTGLRSSASCHFKTSHPSRAFILLGVQCPGAGTALWDGPGFHGWWQWGVNAFDVAKRVVDRCCSRLSHLTERPKCSVSRNASIRRSHMSGVNEVWSLTSRRINGMLHYHFRGLWRDEENMSH